MVDVLTVVALAQLGVLCALATVFVVVYSRRSHGAWHSTPEGRHLMRFTGILAVTFGLTLGFQLVGHLVPAEWALAVSVIVYSGLIVELANRLRLLLRGNGSAK